ncbi:MAG TPA: FAD-dependent oxidoreductase [Thermoleophilaceae bacterium]|nr:FAD-dependent oxidoreductase [Thermoleophilaceae bacterium]
MHDYVIVGAGSAGCVLASRLSEDPDTSVLLIEAGGPDSNDLVHIPAAFSALYRTAQDWDHSTGYEPHCGNRRIFLPRGRVLGGSSSINAMVYIRGNRADYDEWRDLAGDGWGYDDLLPYFKRAEDNERGADEWHGAGGPLPVSEGRSDNPLTQAFVAAAEACGMPPNADFNGARQEGCGQYQVTQRDGARASTAVTYLHPAMERPNLDVETHVEVVKLLFDGDRAVGVQGVRLSEPLEFRAGREVIVACGTYNSPQLLMLSGIGRPDELEALQIDVVAESPGIGQNLHDHPNAGASFRIAEEVSLFGALNDENLERFQTEGRGPLTSNVAEAGGFARTREGLEAPDVQLHFAPSIFDAEGLVPGQEHGFALGACVLKPKSRGLVALASPDPTAKPLIVHNYYAEPDDLASAVAGLRLSLEIARTSPLGDYATGPYNAPESDSEEDLVAHIRMNVQTLYHPVGTCKMGTDEMAVVDPELRVRGVEGLRVVDASVMPTVPRGNTNAPTIALAEKAADLIRGREAPTAEPAAAAPASA